MDEKMLVSAIVESMRKYPKEWMFGDCTVENKKGLAVWIANIPMLDMDIYRPIKTELSFKSRWRLMVAIRELKLSKLMNENV